MKEVIDRIKSLGGKPALTGNTGIEDAVLDRILDGTRGVSTTELDKIAATLDTSVHWLLTGEEDPFRVVFAGSECMYPFED
jgi:hypothetical protein